jgi:CDP-diacylglycerol--glycerol-3-phosphate 3-phosphatidyltransferase
MRREFWTIPNALSILRILLVLPFTAAIFSSDSGGRWWALFWMGLGVLTDKLDGDIARWTRSESEWGRILDPLADKVGVGVAALALLVKGWLPLWFVAVLLLRDAVILLGGLVIKQRTGEVIPSNMAGKWAVGVIGGTLIVAIVDNTTPFLTFCMGLSLVMVALSTVGYLKRFVQIMRAPGTTDN